jgi:hypothetical protein
LTEPWEIVARLRPKFVDRAAEYDRTGAFPAADFDDLRTAGMFGLFTPRELGGMGRDYADYAGGIRAGAGQRCHRSGVQHARVDHGALAGVPTNCPPWVHPTPRRGSILLRRGGASRQSPAANRRASVVPTDHEVRAVDGVPARAGEQPQKCFI